MNDQNELKDVVSVIRTINQLRSRIIGLSSGTEENLSLYTEYYEYVEQLCYAFPIDQGLVKTYCNG